MSMPSTRNRYKILSGNTPFMSCEPRARGWIAIYKLLHYGTDNASK